MTTEERIARLETKMEVHKEALEHLHHDVKELMSLVVQNRIDITKMVTKMGVFLTIIVGGASGAPHLIQLLNGG